jgi:hypothetical protein
MSRQGHERASHRWMTMKMLNRNNATCNVVCVNEPSGKGIYTDPKPASLISVYFDTSS